MISTSPLGSFESAQERDEITYGVQLFDCLPTSISKVEYSPNNFKTFDSIEISLKNMIGILNNKRVYLITDNYKQFL